MASSGVFLYVGLFIRGSLRRFTKQFHTEGVRLLGGVLSKKRFKLV